MSLPITWDQVTKTLSKYHPKQIQPFTSLADEVSFICPVCGNTFSCVARQIWVKTRNSCGCLFKNRAGRRSEVTYGMVRAKLNNLELLGDYPDSKRVKNINKPGAHQFKCKCGKIFGDKTQLKGVYSGNTTSCGCVKIEKTKEANTLRRGKPITVKQRAVIEAKFAITKEQLNKVLDPGMVLNVSCDPMSTREPVECKCRCGRTFTARAADIARGFTQTCGCIKSMIELNLYDYVRSLVPDVIHNDRKAIAPKEIDVFIPSKKIAIELDGLYWHSEERLGVAAKRASQEKVNLIQAAGLTSLILYEDEWRDKREACEWLIKALLGLKEKVFARNCTVVKDGKDFIEKYHLQGTGRATVTLGLAYNGEIAAGASWAPVVASPGTWELTRYCVGPTAILGGLGKLLAAFRRLYPGPIITFSDNRFGTGRLYEATGFVKVGVVEPRYFYFQRHKAKRCHRFGFRKEELARRGWLQNNETEWECMQRMGYDRIWDAGKIKWFLK